MRSTRRAFSFNWEFPPLSPLPSPAAAAAVEGACTRLRPF